MTQSAQATVPHILTAADFICVDCQRPITADEMERQFGRCNGCACSKYGVPERRETEFKSRLEP